MIVVVWLAGYFLWMFIKPNEAYIGRVVFGFLFFLFSQVFNKFIIVIRVDHKRGG
jgi:hypothetical protein